MRRFAWWWCLTTLWRVFAITSWSLVEASMDLGANGWQTFRYVVLPNLASALLAGMLAFALSFDEIIVTTFTAGHERTLPCGCSINWAVHGCAGHQRCGIAGNAGDNTANFRARWLTREGDTLAGNGK